MMEQIVVQPENKPLILTQLRTRLSEIFSDKIDLSDVSNKSATEKENYFTTRAFLALYFLDKIGLSVEQAASCITDGGKDDGIDAIYVDKTNAKIYFCQSKWKNNVNKGVELNDFTRFRDGVRAIINGSWTEDNADLHRFKDDINIQLSNIDTEIIMVLGHTSDHAISENIQSKIDDFLKEQNKYNPDFIRWSEFRLAEAAHVARSHTRPENINVPILLTSWGQILEPYKAVYGSVNAADVVTWFEKHGNRLFSENLRFGIEKSEVNDGIFNTALNEPHKFWYYNNGITAICDTVDKQPIGGTSTESGAFDVAKISIINGAQTISTLHRAKLSGANIDNVRVHIRIISINNTPDDFAAMVTSANNTQNDLNPVDFVAADPNQDRIRREAAQIGLVYSYRRGDKEPEISKGFTIRAATIAAACSSGELQLAVTTKRYISGLWENTKKEPYTKLFGPEVSALALWKKVSVMNAVDKRLAENAEKLIGRERLVAVHGNRFILFCVFENKNISEIMNKENIEEIKEKAIERTDLLLPMLIKNVMEAYPEAYPGNIFKNQEKQKEILDHISIN